MNPIAMRKGDAMLVTQMLKIKKQTAASIVWIAPDATIREAAAKLAEHRIGALVVSPDGTHPAGILSERDIVRELAGQGVGVMDKLVMDLMTRDIETCKAADDAMDVLNRMTIGRFRHLPVIDDAGQMIGVVSIGDAVSGRLAELAAEKEALTGMIMGN